jgi:hypothetical protein
MKRQIYQRNRKNETNEITKAKEKERSRTKQQGPTNSNKTTLSKN